MFRTPRSFVDENRRSLSHTLSSRLSRERRRRTATLEWLEDRTLLST
jgi:hypothetical protein